MAGNKRERLQLRMHPSLKEWFKDYSEGRGGMSGVVHGHVEQLYAHNTGCTWSERDLGKDNGQADPGQREGAPTPEERGDAPGDHPGGVPDEQDE